MCNVNRPILLDNGLRKHLLCSNLKIHLSISILPFSYSIVFWLSLNYPILICLDVYELANKTGLNFVTFSDLSNRIDLKVIFEKYLYSSQCGIYWYFIQCSILFSLLPPYLHLYEKNLIFYSDAFKCFVHGW